VCGGAVNHAIEVGMVFHSYPSRVVWADIGPSMSKEEFPLAPAESYKVHFDAYLRSPDGHVMFLQSQQLYETWPGHDAKFQLYTPYSVDVKTGSHGTEPILSITYHVQ
jgi:hypothetical protein